MGFDITFHPVSKDEIDYYVFSVADNPELAELRVSELTDDPDEQDYIMDAYYSNFSMWIDEIKELSKQDNAPHFASRFGFATAGIIGYIRPFWYSRGQAISFLARKSENVKTLIIPLTQIARGSVKDLPDSSNGIISQNYMSSGFIDNIDKLEELLDSLSQPKGWKKIYQGNWRQGESLLEELFFEDGVTALHNVIEYARINKLGLMEAADIYGPSGSGTKDENCQTPL